MNARIRLQEYKNQFSEWDDNRIKALYERFKMEFINFSHIAIVSLDAPKKMVFLIQRFERQLGVSSIFSQEQIKSVAVFLVTYENEIKNQLIVSNKEDDYVEFNKWFRKLLEIDICDGGLKISNGFAVELSEISKTEGYSVNELADCIESEGLVS